MTLIEQIRAEIERLNEDIVSNNIDCHPITVLDDLLSFLDTLEENPVDLEKDAVMYCFDKGINLSPKDASEFARHFYELGRKAK